MPGGRAYCQSITRPHHKRSCRPQISSSGFAAYSALGGEVDDFGVRARWRQVEAAVRAVLFVLVQILAQDVAQVALAATRPATG
jgi:hypothetical protein